MPTSSASIAPGSTPIVAPSLAPIAVTWQGSCPVSGKTTTAGIGVDPKTGDIWAGVPFENRFWIFSPGGKYLESWAGNGPGTGDGQFDFNDHAQNPDGITAIAFAPDGTFFVADVGNNRVQKFDASRHFVTTWGKFGTGDGQFAQPIAVATDGTTVYVGDGGRGDIQTFDSNGKFLREFGSDGGFGAYLALDAKGNLYAVNPATGSVAIGKFDSTGKQLARYDMSWVGGDPVGLAVDPLGNIFVGTADTRPPGESLGTYELSPSGQLLRGWSIGGGEALALSPKGDDVYISRGIALDSTRWTAVKAYAIPKE